MKYLKGDREKRAMIFMMQAGEVAHRAQCDIALCGAVIVHKGEIIGAGYNAPPGDLESNRMCHAEIKNIKPGHDTTCCMHAEWRAIIDALKNNPQKIVGSDLYFTRVDKDGMIKKSGKPYCTVCSRMALDVGIKNFLLWHEQGIAEYVTDEYNKLSYAYTED